jgi:hypothetical protein
MTQLSSKNKRKNSYAKIIRGGFFFKKVPTILNNPVKQLNKKPNDFSIKINQCDTIE